MKKLVISAVSALMLTGGSLAATNIGHSEAAVQKASHVQTAASSQAVSTKLTKLPEYATVAAQIDMSTYKGQVVEDNASKRVIVFKDANNRQQYKSIFMKRDNRLKVIDFKGGMLFNQVIKVATASKTTSTTTTATKGKVSASVDLSSYSSVIVEDNSNKRITLYKDAKGQVQYKTILVKRTNQLKVIKL